MFWALEILLFISFTVHNKEIMAIWLHLCFLKSRKWEVFHYWHYLLHHWHFVCCSYFLAIYILNQKIEVKQIYLIKEMRLSTFSLKEINIFSDLYCLKRFVIRLTFHIPFYVPLKYVQNVWLKWAGYWRCCWD